MTENERKIKALIGLCKKAGKITVGLDLVQKSIRKRESGGVKLCICSVEASENTKKKIQNTSSYYRVPLYTMQIGKEELGRIVGAMKEISVICVTDKGFGEAIIDYIRKTDDKNQQGSTVLIGGATYGENL